MLIGLLLLFSFGYSVTSSLLQSDSHERCFPVGNDMSGDWCSTWCLDCFYFPLLCASVALNRQILRCISFRKMSVLCPADFKVSTGPSLLWPTWMWSWIAQSFIATTLWKKNNSRPYLSTVTSFTSPVSSCKDFHIPVFVQPEFSHGSVMVFYHPITKTAGWLDSLLQIEKFSHSWKTWSRLCSFTSRRTS